MLNNTFLTSGGIEPFRTEEPLCPFWTKSRNCGIHQTIARMRILSVFLAITGENLWGWTCWIANQRTWSKLDHSQFSHGIRMEFLMSVAIVRIPFIALFSDLMRQNKVGLPVLCHYLFRAIRYREADIKITNQEEFNKGLMSFPSPFLVLQSPTCTWAFFIHQDHNFRQYLKLNHA